MSNQINLFNIFNMKKVALALIYKEGKYLAISRKDNHEDFGFIGGKVEEGETTTEAVIREIQEETGLIALKVTAIDEVEYRGNLVTIFLCENIINWEDLALGATPEGFVAFKTKEELINGNHSYVDFNRDVLTKIYLWSR